jgi:hypothetical protein
MNTLGNALIVLLLSSAQALAAAPASENSIKQLLTVTQAQKLIDGMRNQVDAMINASVKQALNGKTPNPSEQKAINNMRTKMVAVVQGELAWEKLEPLYLRLYKESFTEEEVAGMLVFYKTPAGQAVIHKMPVLMQKTMLEVQTMLRGVMPKLQQIQQDFVGELKAAGK